MMTVTRGEPASYYAPAVACGGPDPAGAVPACSPSSWTEYTTWEEPADHSQWPRTINANIATYIALWSTKTTEVVTILTLEMDVATLWNSVPNQWNSGATSRLGDLAPLPPGVAWRSIAPSSDGRHKLRKNEQQEIVSSLGTLRATIDIRSALKEQAKLNIGLMLMCVCSIWVAHLPPLTLQSRHIAEAPGFVGAWCSSRWARSCSKV